MKTNQKAWMTKKKMHSKRSTNKISRKRWKIRRNIMQVKNYKIVSNNSNKNTKVKLKIC